jgi:hypothetical protein
MYRTLLGVAVAALLAAWLPFSVLYINALTNHAAALARAGTHTLTLHGGHAASAPAPITTRTSSTLAPVG